MTDELLAWLDVLDAAGLSIGLEDLGLLLDQAPEPAKQTQEYYYLKGLFDGRFLHEELKGTSYV